MLVGKPRYENTNLLDKIAKGDEQAFSTLFERYWNHVYSVAFILTKSQQTAEDLVQEIFTKVWEHRLKLPEMEDFDNFLFIVARNHIYNKLRQLSRQHHFLDRLAEVVDAPVITPEQQLMLKESRNLVEDAVNQLTNQQRAVYRLSRERNMTYEQIAAELSISKSTVRNHMIEALRSIRIFLEQRTEGALFILSMLHAGL